SRSPAKSFPARPPSSGKSAGRRVQRSESLITANPCVVHCRRRGCHGTRDRLSSLPFEPDFPSVWCVFTTIQPLDLLPRQGSSACCCILTRRASEGSASEPALARRKICEI